MFFHRRKRIKPSYAKKGWQGVSAGLIADRKIVAILFRLGNGVQATFENGNCECDTAAFLCDFGGLADGAENGLVQGFGDQDIDYLFGGIDIQGVEKGVGQLSASAAVYDRSALCAGLHGGLADGIGFPAFDDADDELVFHRKREGS